jgi:hypothetical protein
MKTTTIASKFILLIILLLVLSIGYLLMEMSKTEDPQLHGLQQSPMIFMHVETTEVFLDDPTIFTFEIRNTSENPLYINVLPEDIFFLKKTSGEILLTQCLTEEMLVQFNKKTNSKNGGIPGIRVIEPGKTHIFSKSIELPYQEETTVSLAFSLGFNTKPRSDYLVEGGTYHQDELYSRFLAWQKCVTSKPIRISLRKKPQTTDQKSPSTRLKMLQVMIHQGEELRDAKKISEAESMFLRAMTLADKLFTGPHESFATIHADLGILYLMAGKLKEAEEHFLRANQVMILVFGKNHPDTVRSSLNLVNFLIAASRLADAEKELVNLKKSLDAEDTDSVELAKLHEMVDDALHQFMQMSENEKKSGSTETELPK